MFKKLLEKTASKMLVKLLPLSIEVEQAKKAPVGTEFPIEGALPDVRALGRVFELDLIARIKK